MKIYVEFSDTMRICDQRPKINASIVSLNSFFYKRTWITKHQFAFDA